MMNLLATAGPFGISPSADQLMVINLSAILVGTTFNAPQKVIKWGGLVIAVVTATCALWCGH
ncbi:Conserved hypothetical protein [Prochlorococcus marinus str. MIT 9313]|uniref:Uncharacterized protein n=2 Tax=Prochlorococcaceae TaxID=2881426 RepID=B9ES64_PROMM|nr:MULTISPECIES: hypothetical protein [Prochlorococcus]KZR62807.1 hypothetical protein PMIT1312_02277 [Prochlorococcus marinus str. MIT 1312]KZR80713.1 hypothetical protein PMIT1327_01157 [Prochlorococcus marinus str. MIT 1327]MEC7738694.1 hypothetical protein [Cyanobacteriota bacterium]CAX32202.1 Conserved hypothetical protein [Prochlorococcus marinus str. MIT 9313]|tara:strand:- start:148 stop:333 length:186 start_codon:yes stop_codon:yes gene_type:complete